MKALTEHIVLSNLEADPPRPPLTHTKHCSVPSLNASSHLGFVFSERLAPKDGRNESVRHPGGKPYFTHALSYLVD